MRMCAIVINANVIVHLSACPYVHRDRRIIMFNFHFNMRPIVIFQHVQRCLPRNQMLLERPMHLSASPERYAFSFVLFNYMQYTYFDGGAYI